MADRVPPELRRVVEFLNRQMQPAEVLAVEPRQYHCWCSVAYKGGSETGVLNRSALVVAKGGQRHIVVATWNDVEALALERLVEPFRDILRLLEDNG